MLALATDPAAWLSLLTLTVLEIVLGIDNIIVISMVTMRLPAEIQAKTQLIGLMLALVMRLFFLSLISWLVHLTDPVITVLEMDFSWRDIILLGGGLFLIYKAVQEIRQMIIDAEAAEIGGKKTTFLSAIIQIVLLDIVFSLDSIITAVGVAKELPVMIAAVIIAMVIMMVATKPVSDFIHRHPSIKMLALAFLILVGVILVADGLHYHISRNYLYAAMGFSLLVEILNLVVRNAAAKRVGR